MIGTIHITGVIGEDTNLLDIIRQVKAQKTATEFIVKIDSVGGYVDAGFDIYDYLVNLPQNVTTYATQAYSIASVIFMAGSIRIVPENAEQPLMAHLPWAEFKGSHSEVMADLSILKNAEDRLLKFYSEQLEIDKSTLQSLLSTDCFISSTKAIELGFATTIQPAQRAVAMITNNKEKEEESLMNKLTKEFQRRFNKAMASLSGVRAELVLQDSTGVEVVFPELAPNDVPEQGEKATIDGKPAEGSHVMPDGSTITFEGGVLKEILPAEPTEDENAPQDAEGDAPTEDEQADDKDARIAELESENEELKAKIAELEGSKAEETTETDNKMLEVVAMAAEKVNELQGKYEALAKQVGSDYQPNNKKEANSTVKASAEQMNRAWAILNSK
ncbi:ATP-dependent Clp protease proteolytic subunit [Flavobacterium sp.]|uniref:ATP-dependent Clp protease proteolytic subunit n=1 Tax=Flavobacterium sp. TaxID=239 RepID=UPI004034A3AC